MRWPLKNLIQESHLAWCVREPHEAHLLDRRDQEAASDSNPLLGIVMLERTSIELQPVHLFEDHNDPRCGFEKRLLPVCADGF